MPTAVPAARPFGFPQAKPLGRPRVEARASLAHAALIGLALLAFAVFFVAPLVVVFVQAFAKGLGGWVHAVTDPATRSAAWLTVVVALVSVPLNTAFGICAAWLVSRFDFPGKNALLTLIDLPFAVSPVIAGMMLVLVFGTHGLFGPFLVAHGWRVVFAPAGVMLATLFVTLPFVARELIPLMQEQGSEEEQASIVLGAGAWQTFWRVTLPKVKWGLLYGAIVCNARAMGEFGAVSVVSGHIRGETNTLPLHVEVLYDGYDFTGAFAAASLLALLAILTLVVKELLELRGAPRARR